MRTNPIFLLLLTCIFLSDVGNPIIFEQCRTEGYSVEATGEEKYIQSTNYSQSYPKNMDCMWILKAQTPGYVVKVVVQDSTLEAHEYCSFDYVTAYDGPSDSSTQLQRWCGTQIPTLFSSGQYLTLRFVTDSSTQEKGFRLSFKEVPGGDNTITIERCRTEGYTVEAIREEKYIQSTNYPQSYPKNLDCKWFLRTQTPRYVIKVVVHDSHLESSSACSLDYVTAYDGPSDSSTQLQKWCGTQTPTLQSSDQYLTLRFVTNSSTQERGFRLSFKEVPGSQPPPKLNRSVVGSAVGIGVPAILCSFCFCCLHYQKKKRGGASSSTAPPGGTSTTSSAPNSGANHQVFYTSTYSPSLGRDTDTNPTSPSAYAPPPYPGPPSQHSPVQNPAYPEGGYTYPQPSAPPQRGGMGGPVAPPPERQESLPSEPPPPYWQASQYQLHPGGNTSAGTAAEGGSGGGQPVSGGGQLTAGGGQPTSGSGQLTAGGGQPTSGSGQPISGGGQLTAGGGQTTSGSAQPTAGYRDNPAYIPDGN